jgi:hypothetical protein
METAIENYETLQGGFAHGGIATTSAIVKDHAIG